MKVILYLYIGIKLTMFLNDGEVCILLKQSLQKVLRTLLRLAVAVMAGVTII